MFWTWSNTITILEITRGLYSTQGLGLTILMIIITIIISVVQTLSEEESKSSSPIEQYNKPIRAYLSFRV